MKAIGLAVLFAFGIRFFLFVPIVVEGVSMMPTLEEGDKVGVNKIGVKFADYDRFDVIVFETNEGTNYIKRIIGVPGDHIEYKNDTLFINGTHYEEAYLKDCKKALIDNGTLTENFALESYLGETIVPDGHYFVLGDNRQRSKDSRDPRIGFVPKEEILGTAEAVLFPFDYLEKKVIAKEFFMENHDYVFGNKVKERKIKRKD